MVAALVLYFVCVILYDVNSEMTEESKNHEPVDDIAPLEDKVFDQKRSYYETDPERIV